uniref:hypothetical protein n=1 Tax=Flavobacterium sp. TaxID=239 RepID=UPI00404A16D3
MEILDCTIRDGGYYNNWDFDRKTVKSYLQNFEKLPVDFLEIGYRNPILSGYFGEYFFCKTETLQFIRSNTTKKLVIIINEKSIRIEDLHDLLDPCTGIIEMIRIAVDPVNFDRALILASHIKKKGFKIAINVMYMSSWDDYPEMLEGFVKLEGLVDYLYLVDSYGGVFPQDVIKIIRKIKGITNIKLGFHGHNNLEMALANTLVAIEEGIDIVDSTITGMGRGAGNLKTELLLTTLDFKMNLDLNYDALSIITSDFLDLQKEYNWGTSLPYMISGAKSLPQKQVMEWLSKRFYSLNSITRAINFKKEVYPIFNPKDTFDNVLIIGGGQSVAPKINALIDFINIKNPALVHASSRNSALFENVKNKQYFCLIGNEGARLESVFNNLNNFVSECVLPPSPREMGTYVPNLLKPNTFELSEINFTKLNIKSHLSIAIQTALSLGVKTIYLAGFDGYYGDNVSAQFQELFIENNNLFREIPSNIKCISLTQSKYESITQATIYYFIK